MPESLSGISNTPSIGPSLLAVPHIPGQPSLDIDRNLRRILAMLQQNAALTEALELDAVDRRISTLESIISDASRASSRELHTALAAILGNIDRVHSLAHDRFEHVERRQLAADRDIAILTKSVADLTALVERDLWTLFWRSAWSVVKRLFRRLPWRTA